MSSTAYSQQIAPDRDSQGLKEPPRHEIPRELKQASDINQRYEEMLRSNQSRRSQQNSQISIGHNVNTSQKLYVRQNLPSRLVPPGRSQDKSHSYRSRALPSSKGSGVATQFASPTNLPLQQRSAGYWQNQHVVPSGNRYYPGSSGQPGVNFNHPVQQQIPTNQKPSNRSILPPIVQPRKNVKPFQLGDTKPKVEQGEVITASQSVESPAIPRSSRIPFDTNDNTKVTRARILLVQESGDPFGQAEQNQGDDSNSGQDDPFADPDINQRPGNNQSGNSFGEPPNDLNQQQDPQDPFADPPQDSGNNNQNVRDPFGDPPNRIQDADPFPNNPNDIRANQPLDQTPSVEDSGTGLPDTTSQDQSVESKQEPEIILGPFKSRRGFEPSPILPAPPQREFDGAIMHAIPSFQNVPEYYDQPTFFGTEFDKSQLYEGITHDGVEATQYCESVPGQPLPFARPRLFNRICRNSNCYAPNCTGCSPNASYPPCEIGCNQNLYLNQNIVSGGQCTSCSDECFAPMFYVSVFGGYTQLEPVGPFGVSNQIIPFAPITTVSANDGYGIGIALGQYQGPNLRTELEFVYRSNAAENVMDVTTTINNFNIDGSFESYAGMLNLIWDFQPRPIFGSVQPYVGGGLGFAFVDPSVPENSIIEDNETQSAFAYQLMAGLSRPVSYHMEGFIEYRYFRSDQIRVLASGSSGDAVYETDNVFLGLRMQF